MFDIEKFEKALELGNVTVSFVKKDGSDRIMKCTLNMDNIPVESHPVGGNTTSPNVMNVWDLDKSAWRSFRKDSVTEWKVIN